MMAVLVVLREEVTRACFDGGRALSCGVGNAMARTGMQPVKDVRVLLRSFRDQVARLINSGVTDPLKYLEQI